MPLEGMPLGKYRLLRLIGSGGMGDVYLGEDPGIHRQVAIKVMRGEAAPYPDEESGKKSERLFQREMRAVAMLDHPHILSLYDYGEETLHRTALMYMVMPYRQEGSLSDWLRQRAGSGSLPLPDVVPLFSQAADALQHAHDHQVIHQDVKPSNFLIRSKRDPASVPDLLLADFGIARVSTLTSSISHSSRGTPIYMAPEQWTGEPVSATDQYALAVMIYELLTGRPPFRGRPEQLMYWHLNTPPSAPSTLAPSLPPGV
ncbi:MAG TPA: serine/threonine-protein kinase, partial [Ktedonosporobacter sp.]|nr:serine/threonine-protein kinase [Ktedonosporobacter sp.]